MVSTERVKEYLEQAGRFKKSLDRITVELFRMQKINHHLTEQTRGITNFLPVKTDIVGISNQSEELKKQLAIEYQNTLNGLSEIIKTVNEIPDESTRKVIHMRYVDLMSWNKINRLMRLSAKDVNQIHGSALLTLSEMLVD